MLTEVQCPSGLVFSIKTFRPLWVFPWHASIWRQFPLPACVATIRFENKSAALAAHGELTKLLEELPAESQMPDARSALEHYCQSQAAGGIRSFQVYEEEIEISINVERAEDDS